MSSYTLTAMTKRKDVNKVLMVIHEYKGAEAFTYGETINVSSVYLEGYQGNVKWEFTSLIYHEMTHVWQWNGAGQAPVGLVEGIADYTILKANYYSPSYAKPGMGDRWDQGYDFTARFLEYCEGIRPGFVAALNRKMKDNFSVGFFDELLGKPCDELWREYKEKYGYRVERNVSGYLNDSRNREYKDRYEPMPQANVRVPRTTG
ncbi:plant basic secretory protein (BSP) family protein [Actinidia rufa]|uniref:Plant basic secretory protein (BSP) family protein n=1 Tax=Actinidia rufa TaxID=165716 RepID=A0A7J0DTH2_9ERIC|nr:plant basic secretory protein (BSP) family protein [Actinidia rufa]